MIRHSLLCNRLQQPQLHPRLMATMCLTQRNAQNIDLALDALPSHTFDMAEGSAGAAGFITAPGSIGGSQYLSGIDLQNGLREEHRWNSLLAPQIGLEKWSTINGATGVAWLALRRKSKNNGGKKKA